MQSAAASGTINDAAALVIKEGGVVLFTEPKSTIIALQPGIPQKPEGWECRA